MRSRLLDTTRAGGLYTMKLTKLDKNAHWWKGTRTAWWYQDKDGWCWIIRDQDREKKVETKPKRIKERSSKLSYKFYLCIATASATGVFIAILISKYLLV